MPSKFIVLVIFLVAGFALQARAVTISNELGTPKAGGLPREQSPAYEILYGSVRVGQEVQRVIVTIPPGAGPKPAFFFIGGMGCYSLDFSGSGPKAEAYQRILDFVTKLGFVTMRVEKTGMGDSVGTPCESQDFKREVAGNLAGLKALVSYPFVKRDQVYIFGHSIGGVIAPFLAAEVPVKAVAALGTLASDWYSYDLSNGRRQYGLSGMSPTDVDVAVESLKLFDGEFYLKKKTPEQIVAEQPQLASYLKMAAHWTYMQQLSEVNPAADWNRSRAPVVIFSGASDFIGSQFGELAQMIQLANKTRSTSIRLVSVANTDHFFRAAESQQASFNNQSVLGMPLFFQENFLTTLRAEFLSL